MAGRHTPLTRARCDPPSGPEVLREGGSVPQAGPQFHGLAIAIHQTSKLVESGYLLLLKETGPCEEMTGSTGPFLLVRIF